ncbi:MAG: HAD family hydrolase [Tannerellaceae bacterium]|jgi:putative hydrolase of the HAD superfamily|nr:HAD family hydrolase [Tannerellaceae bacterium]
MFHLSNLKGILFDYGGTIDTNGTHWAEVLWESYQTLGIPVTKESFRKAYVHAEQTLGHDGAVSPSLGFRLLLESKAQLQLQWLKDQNLLAKKEHTLSLAAAISARGFSYAQTTVNALGQKLLQPLAARYPLVLVSNFYGNLHAVLADFRLEEVFACVIESAAVGVRKPDPAIYRLGLEQLRLLPEEVLVVGDSYTNDILPAASLGCHTVWLKKSGWEGDEQGKGKETPGIVIRDLMELREIVRL